MAVRGSRLGARFTVAGITEYLKKKEKSRLEYERIKADIEQESGRYDDYAEWDISDVKESVGIDTAGSVQKEYESQKGISVYMRALTGSVRKRTFVMTRRKCSMVLRLMNLTGSGRE